MLIAVLLLIAAGCAVAVYRWRWGVFAAIAVGLLQDPLRKMVPGVPGYLAMATFPVWVTTLGAALFSGEVSLRPFLGTFPRLARWVVIFGLYLLIPAVLSGTYGTNSWQITLLGAAVYLTAFLSIVAGWRFPRQERMVIWFLMFYALAGSAALIGGPLDYFGVANDFKAVGTEAMGSVWMTARTGEIVYMYAGFFRGPDVMGWHAALVTMIASLMASRSRGWVRGLWLALSVWGILNIWICGRRKMIAMLPVFWGMFLLLTTRFRTVRRAVPLAGGLLLVLGLGWFGVARTYKATAVDAFYMTVFDQLSSSVQKHGVEDVIGTVEQAGFWGYGLGMGQQGVHHLPAERPRLWQESGPSKMVAELGVPGTLLLLTVGGILLLTAYHVVGRNRNSPLFYCYAGLFSILVANILSAVVSGQIFGDPFIILFLSILVGILLSGARTVPPEREDLCRT